MLDRRDGPAVCAGRALIVGDSLAAPRLRLKYSDTWICSLKAAFPALDFNILVEGGRTTRFLALNPTRMADGRLVHDEYSLEAFEPRVVILNLGIVDCAPRIFSRRESFFVARLPGGVREPLVRMAKRIRPRSDLRAYVPPGEFEENVLQYLDRCRKSNVEKLVIIGIPTPDSRALSNNAGLAEAAVIYNQILVRLCEKFDFSSFIDPLHPSERVSSLYLEDGYHLSKLGHAAVFNAIAPLLEEIA